MVATPETIVFEPNDGEMNKRVRELPAAAAITPGMLVERAAGEVQAHSTAQGSNSKLFAIENTGVAGVIDDAYVAGDTTPHYAAQTGDRIYALVAAGTAAIVADAYLASDGAGGMITMTDVADDIPAKAVAQALEAVDNSGGGTAVRIMIEVL
jgi:hypothetical protein